MTKTDMKYFTIYGKINNELFEKFVPFYNDNQAEPCTIVINTGGGDNYFSETIIYMINEMKDCRLIIHAAYSCGLLIALEVNCPIILASEAKGMWHYSKATIDIDTKGKPYYHEDACMLKNLPITHKKGNRLAKKIMTAKEYKKYKKGEELYFDFKRMKQIFPDATILK